MTEVVELTKRLVALPTVTGKIQPAHTRTVANLLEFHGYAVKQHGEHLLAMQGEGKTHLAFVSHYDVVPPGNGWETDPFEAQEKDGILYGRGVSDMKGALAVHIIAGKQLADLGARVSLFIAADEETESKGMPALLSRADAIRGPRISYAIGGEATSKKISGDCVNVGRRGVVQGNVTFYGQQGHAAYKNVKNVLHDLGKIVAAFKLPIDKGNKDFPPSTCNITNIHAGTGAYNVIPGEFKLQFDARLSSETTPDAYLKKLNKRLEDKRVRFNINVTKHTSPFHSKDKFLRSVTESVIRSAIGKKPVFSTEGGMSDVRFFAEKGIPCIEIGVPKGNIHGVDEYVSIQELERLEDIYVKLGKRLIQ